MVEVGLQIPARLIAEMREDCVDAGESLGGIDFIEFIFVSAVFSFYGQEPMPREVFEGNGRRGVQHTNSQYDVI